MDRIMGVPYIHMAVGLALLTGAIVLGVEKLVPWTTDSVPVSVYSCIKQHMTITVVVMMYH